ncbi:MAG: hypothetical protein OXI24_14685 [Candidatus Poribacteria bacterium]|nr:hypothetical protein [Candidatus Poribacteria bacterium]
MLKTFVCSIPIIFACFSIAILPEAFSDSNNQRWNYTTIYYVCPNGDIYSTAESRSLETWTDGDHPEQSRYWGQKCVPKDLREPNGPQICWDDWIYYHTSHSVYWHSATYLSATQTIDAMGCR